MIRSREKRGRGWLRQALCGSLITLALLAAASPALATPGSVDTSFGTEGIARAELGPHYERTSFTDVKPQNDGGLFATRETSNAPPGKSRLIRRFEPNGSLDPTFPAQPAPEPRVEAAEEGGKILVAERVEGGGDYRLERFNLDETPDTVFGVSGKSEAVPFAIEEIVPLPSGKILVAGRGVFQYQRDLGPIEQISLARFDPEGKLDTGFGKVGVVKLHTDYSLAGSNLQGVFPRKGEGAVVAVDSGGSGEPGSGAFMAGLTATGALDPSYGTAGVAQLSGSIVTAQALSEGRIVVAGNQWGAKVGCCGHYESNLFLARYTADGQPDPSFGTADGTATADFGGVDIANTMQQEGDGSVLIGGSTIALSADCLRFEFCDEAPVLARFTPDGHLDPSFGTGGLLRLDAVAGPAELMSGRGVAALAPRPGGGIFAAGGSGNVAFLAEIGSAGAPDPSFGNAGIVTEQEPVLSSDLAGAVAIDRESRILVAGRTTAGVTNVVPGGAVVRYLPDGALDRSFGNGAGYVRVPGWGEAIAVALNGSSFVLSGGEYESEITRVTAAGEIDDSFGEEGTVLFDPQRQVRPRLESLAVLPGGGVIAAGETRGQRMVVYRLRPNGSLDRSFGRNGMLILGFGKGRRCGARQVAVQPDGRILLAGHVGSHLALIRLLPNGARDRSFGYHGRLIPPVGKQSEATAVATQGGKVLVAGWLRRGGRTWDLLLRYTRGGHLDRSFARAGISRVSVRPPGGQGSFNETAEILPSRRRIVVVRDGPGRPVLGYRRNGRFEPSFASGSDIAPGRSAVPRVFPGPFGALQHGRVVLAWSAALNPGLAIELQRLTSR